MKALSGLNRKLVPKGLCILPLRICGNRALIYAYRPHALKSDLADQRARDLLLQYGYPAQDSNACVLHLIRRLTSAGEFPHEIGLFLSYPPETSSDSSSIKRAGTSALDAGRCTGMKRGQKAPLKNTIFAAGSMCSSGNRGNPSNSLPWLDDVSKKTEREVILSYE